MPPLLFAFELNFTLGVILGLGAALFAGGGVALGFALGRRGGQPSKDKRMKDLMEDLKRGVLEYHDEVSSLLQTYRNQSTKSDETDTESKELLNRIFAASDGLQKRLSDAEKSLQDQAQAISGYASEARTDALTSLPNRRSFDDEMRQRVVEWERHGTPLSIVLLDIDHFKRINDDFGHLAGDEILRRVGEVLRTVERGSEMVARYGGEEFAVILPNCHHLPAAQVADRIRREIECTAFQHEGRSIAVTISCGVAQISGRENAAAVTQRADEALYHSKESGRNCISCHTDEKITLSTELMTQAAAAVDPPPSQKQSGSFDDVCDDLRKRLDSFTNLQDKTC